MFGKDSDLKKIQGCSYDLVGQVAVQRDYYHGLNTQLLIDELLRNHTLDEIKCAVAAAIRSTERQNANSTANTKWAKQVCRKYELPDGFRSLSALDSSTIGSIAVSIQNYEKMEESEYLPDAEVHVMIVH